MLIARTSSAALAGRLAVVQAITLPLLAGAGFTGWGGRVAVALVWGGLTAVAVTLVLYRRARRAERHPEWDQKRLMREFVLTAAERFAVLAVMLIVGLAVWALPPLPVLLGLIAGLAGWLVVVSGKT